MPKMDVWTLLVRMSMTCHLDALTLPKVAAGGTSSFTTTAPTGQMYSWGKLKTNGDNQVWTVLCSLPI